MLYVNVKAAQFDCPCWRDCGGASSQYMYAVKYSSIVNLAFIGINTLSKQYLLIGNCITKHA